VDARDGESQVSVGYDDIDSEHQVQIGLMDALEQAVREGRVGERIDELLERLLDYSRVHFLSEQLLMRHRAYPGYEDHVQDHDRMVASLEELRQAYGEGRTDYGLEIMRTLRADLIAHIRGRDHGLGRYLSGIAAGEDGE
jgi:hemerythrin